MTTVVHPMVNRFVAALVKALAGAERLARFHTTFAAGRRSVEAPRDLVCWHPWRELLRLAAARVGWCWATRHETGWASVDAVYRAVDAAAAKRLKGLAVYAYEDGALACFKRARALGMKTVYDLPIAYHETVGAILKREAERHPDWEPTLGATRDSEAKLERKREEIRLADTVVCPSAFVLGTLPPGTDGVVVPFGSPPLRPLGPERGGPLRVLFAGAMTARKGLPDVFEAVRSLRRRDVQLIVLGAPLLPMEFYRKRGGDFEYWPPRAHAGVLEVMARCDVLVLPSLVEGRALVQQEAMACGLPVVATREAGAAELIEDGKAGRLVPSGDPAALAEAVAFFADHREGLPEMRREAQKRAAALTWEGYAKAIMEILP